MLARIILLAFFAILAPALASAGQTACPAHFFGGQAPDLVDQKLAVKTRPICYVAFGVLHSGLTRTPLWSADHLTATSIAQARQLHRADAIDTFHNELAVPAGERSDLKDYTRSGYDRGHMTPSADMSSPAAQGETFTLANMVPQVPENNRGIWEGVESATRTMAQTYGEVWVVTMPIFAGADTMWLHNRVAIPARIAKAVYIPSQDAASAYLTDNGPGMAWQAISIAQLRAMSGIDPFPALSEQVKAVTIQLPAPTPHGYAKQGGR